MILHCSVPNIALFGPEYCTVRSQILHCTVPNIALYGPEYCTVRSRILHCTVPNTVLERRTCYTKLFIYPLFILGSDVVSMKTTAEKHKETFIFNIFQVANILGKLIEIFLFYSFRAVNNFFLVLVILSESCS